MCKYKEAMKKHKDGATLDLFVTPNARCAFFPVGYNSWRKRIDMRICSQAKNNKANKEVIKIIADYFNKSINDVLIITGDKKREKTVLIKNISYDVVVKRLKEQL